MLEIISCQFQESYLIKRCPLSWYAIQYRPNLSESVPPITLFIQGFNMNIRGKGGREVNRKKGRGVVKNKHLNKKKRLILKGFKRRELSQLWLVCQQIKNKQQNNKRNKKMQFCQQQEKLKGLYNHI